MTGSTRYTDTSKYSQLYRAARCVRHLETFVLSFRRHEVDLRIYANAACKRHFAVQWTSQASLIGTCLTPCLRPCLPGFLLHLLQIAPLGSSSMLVLQLLLKLRWTLALPVRRHQFGLCIHCFNSALLHRTVMICMNISAVNDCWLMYAAI